MSDFELVSGLFDAGIYVVGIVGGIVLFLLGRRRGDKAGGGFMRGLGIVLFLVFGLGAIPAVVREVSNVLDTASPTTTLSVSPTTTLSVSPTITTSTRPSTTTTTQPPCPEDLELRECFEWRETGELPTRLTSPWAEPSELAMVEWSGSAVEYIEGQNWYFDDREDGIKFLRFWARTTCGNLNRNADPIGAEAASRQRLGVDRWQWWGAVLFDDLVNGLCIRR